MKSANRRLIVFFVPPEKIVNGGIMSIFSLCRESRRFSDIHHADVVLCVYPDAPTYGKNDQFENNEHVWSFKELVKSYPKLDFLMLHLPELVLPLFYKGLMPHEEYLQSVGELRINIMNQNIKYMPDEATVASLYRYTPNMTQTTAHDRYATQELCNKYGMPLHHMSVFIDSSQYQKRDFADKENLIAYSNDKHAEKDKILKKMQAELPDYKFMEIKNLTYEQYKDTVAKAKFVITFGEGLDGYFIEPVFSGGITFAAYNELFFPSPDFKELANVYDSYEVMYERICEDIHAFDSAETYRKVNQAASAELEDLYSFKNYLKNIGDFYRGKYTFVPSPAAREAFFLRVIGQKDARIAELDANVAEKAEVALYFRTTAENIKQQMEGTVSTETWRSSRPIRVVKKLRSRKN